MKKQFLSLLTTGLFGITSVFAQNARVQVIHNSADAAASVVDVYVNGAITLNDFAFRTASPFVDVPAGATAVAIAPANSTNVSQAIATFNYTLTANTKYVIVANGIVSPSGYSPATPFNLYVNALGQEAALNSGNTDLLVFHGSTDAPTVSVWETGVGAGQLFNNFTYGDFEGYLPLPTADYVIEVRDNSGTTTVKSYDAPLATLGLQGAAGVVVASGFLNPANNSNGADFGLWVALPTGGALVQLPESTAEIQVIHNSADAAANEVDVYLNGDLVLDNFAFRTATPFVEVPAGVEIEVAIAGANSTSVGDALATFPYTLASGGKYVIVASGIVSPSGYSPATPFNLYVNALGQEAALNSGNTDLLVFHGSTDAPTVSVWETGVGAGQLFNDFEYGDFVGYLPLTTADYVIEVRDNSGTTTVKSYDAPLATLGLQGAAGVVVASGFLNPANNSNGADFGLWVALPTGGALVQLPESTAEIQVIHNSADAAANEVDVYLNGDLVLDNFAFRTATPFVEVPAGVEIEVAIAGPNSTSVSEAIATFPYSLASGGKYIIVANGIVSSTGYSPATPFDLYVYPMAQDAAAVSTNTDVLVFHGSTDAPTVSVWETAVPAGELFSDFTYGDFEGYLELPTADYVVEIRDNSGTTPVAAYSAPLSTLNLDGQSLVVLASGFLNPANNSGGAAFGLWVALSAGGDLVELPAASLTGVEENSAINGLNIYPNPAQNVLNINFSTEEATDVTVNIINANGMLVQTTSLENANAGNRIMTVSTEELAAGIYNLSLVTSTGTETRNFVVVK
ncbi:MAG: hypothetical protein POELPBGB_00490 [Bacteroidia bacterium]|nr:hypothetical protein [Bacteroidia bacterium]